VISMEGCARPQVKVPKHKKPTSNATGRTGRRFIGRGIRKVIRRPLLAFDGNTFRLPVQATRCNKFVAYLSGRISRLHQRPSNVGPLDISRFE